MTFDYDEQLSRISFDKDIFQPKIFVHPQQYLRCDAAFSKLQKEYRSLSIKFGAEVLQYAEKNSEVIVNYKEKGGSSNGLASCGRLVLCAGALNNPLIIRRSTRAEELPMLGLCLMDHPMGNMFQFKYEKEEGAAVFCNSSDA